MAIMTDPSETSHSQSTRIGDPIAIISQQPADVVSVTSSSAALSPVRARDHRHVTPPYYEDIIGHQLKNIQCFILVPEATSSLADTPKASAMERRQWSFGCQSPCGNMWLAAIAFLFETRDVLSDLLQRRRGTAPGKNKVDPVSTNKYPAKLLLAESSARALAKAFLGESNMASESNHYEELIVKSLWGDNGDRSLWMVYCTLEEIPVRVRRWFYVLSLSNLGELQQRALDETLLEATVVSVDTPGRTIVQDQRGSRQTLITAASQSPRGAEGGKFKLEQHLPYEKLLGLVHTVSGEVVEGALVFGTRTGWKGEEDADVAYLTDAGNSGRWYRVLIEHEDELALVLSDQRDEAILRLVSGSPQGVRMAVRLNAASVKPTTPTVYTGTHEGISGVFVGGYSVDSMRILVGYTSRQEQGPTHRFRTVVADPSAVPIILSGSPSLKRQPVSSGLPFTFWTRTFVDSVVAYAMLAATILEIVEAPSHIDALSITAILRMGVDWTTRVTLAYISLWNKGATWKTALFRLFYYSSIDYILMGVPWGKRADADFSQLTVSFWMRRNSIRVRACISVGFIFWAMYRLIQANEGQLPSESITFLIGLVVGPAIVLSEGGLGSFLDELSGARMSGRSLTSYLACCVILEVLALILIGVVLYPEMVHSEKHSLKVWVLLGACQADTLLYSIALLRGRALLRTGLEQEEYTEAEISSGSESRFRALLNRVTSASASWGLGGVANRPGVRGLLTLFETTLQVQASSPLFNLSDWVVATQAGGFVVTPILRGDGAVYEGRDFFLCESLEEAEEPSYYGIVKLQYVDFKSPWTGSSFPLRPVPRAGKRFHQSGERGKMPPAWRRKPRQAALCFGKSVVVPLGPPISVSV